jgi:tetratricopeptide (TPR) repeat protein
MTDEPAHTAEDASETAVPLVEESAEELKKLGNECFATRKYDDALDYYKRALVIDPDNAILYSNRSACYAAQKLWQKAMEDAIMSISKDENFIKGYQRLATAQSELNLHDDAIATLRAALSKEPNNELLAKQLRIVQQKKSGLVAAQKPKKVMSENQRKEVTS